MQLTILDRARLWLQSVPPAISGSGGHNQTFSAATGLVHGFQLSDSDAMSLLKDWNSRCVPPWKDTELEYKINQAKKTQHDKPAGWLRNSVMSIGAPVSPTGKFIVKKIQQAPVDNPFSIEDFLKTCFEKDAMVCICNALITPDDGTSRPASKGTFLKRDDWIQKHFTGKLSNMWVGPNSKGAYIRINPCLDESGNDNGVANFRHVLIEMDEKTKDEQWTVLKESNLPLSVVIDSGGKSLHGWVRVDASNKDEWASRRDIVYKHLEHLGVDPKNKNASRFSRLPGVKRNGVDQKLLAINQGSRNWEEFIEHLEDSDFPPKITAFDILSYDPLNDPDNLIGDRWLRRGSSLLFVGQSGVGKSSMIMYQSLLWAYGDHWFGVKPIRPLKIMFIQAENDIADQYDALKGASEHIFKTDWMYRAKDCGMLFYRETVRTGDAFAVMLRKLIRKNNPDVVYIDPLLSYVGGDLSKQEVASRFLRNLLQPIMIETGVVLIIAHHFPKPKGKDNKPTSIAELAYSGFGSSETTNWAREVLVLVEAGTNNPREFAMALTKRSKRAGMVDGNGNPTGAIKIRHSLTGIAWEYMEEQKFVVDRGSASQPPKRHWKR